MGDDERTRRIVLSVCAVAALALLLVLARIATADWAPGDDGNRTRAGPAVRSADRTGISDATALPERDRSADASVVARRSAAGLRGNPARFFGPDAYPPEAMRAGEQGRTVARLTVGTDGIPTACAIVTSSGSRSLDAATCSIAIGKVRYDPARDMAGQPIEARATLPVRWVLPR